MSHIIGVYQDLDDKRQADPLFQTRKQKIKENEKNKKLLNTLYQWDED